MEIEPHSAARPEVASRLLGSKLLGSLAVTAALLAGGLSQAQAKNSQPKHENQPVRVDQVPDWFDGSAQGHIIPATQDANPPKGFDQARVQAFTSTAEDLNAQAERIVVYPQMFLHGNYASTDLQVAEAKLKGHEIYMTLSGRDVTWNKYRLIRFAKDVVTRYGDDVHWWSIWNEPNFPGEMQRLPGLSKPETYHVEYEIMYNAIKRLNPTANIDIGELNGQYGDAVKFFKQMVSCPRDQQDCKPLKADGFSDHPYALRIDPRKACATGKLGINCLGRMEELLLWAHDQKLLTSEAGGTLPLDLGEFSYNVKAPEIKNNPNIPDPSSPTFLPDNVRLTRLLKVGDIVCSDPNVRLLNIYGPLTPENGWPGVFYTPLVHSSGKKYKSYYFVRNFFGSNSGCIRQPQKATTLPVEVSTTIHADAPDSFRRTVQLRRPPVPAAEQGNDRRHQ
jgi:hypothetical protein